MRLTVTVSLDPGSTIAQEHVNGLSVLSVINGDARVLIQVRDLQTARRLSAAAAQIAADFEGVNRG